MHNKKPLVYNLIYYYFNTLTKNEICPVIKQNYHNHLFGRFKK